MGVWRIDWGSGESADVGRLTLLGVGRPHPIAFLQFEMDMLPLKWEAARRAIDFWVQVMRMNKSKLMKVVMLEGLKLGSKVRWVKDFTIVWRDVGQEDWM